MGASFWFPWEPQLMMDIQAAMNPVTEALAKFFTMFGETEVLVVILGLLYWVIDKKQAKYVMLHFLPQLLFCSIVKSIVMRRRPYFDHEGIRVLKPVSTEADIMDITVQGYSFPSMHASDTMTIFGSIAVYMRKRWMTVAAVLLTLCVGVSRVCLGVHYPTDVIAGWAVGMVTILGLGYCHQKVDDRWIYGTMLVMGLAGMFICKNTDFFDSYGLILGITASFHFEAKHVRFENTRNWLIGLGRLVGGVAVFLLVSQGLKPVIGLLMPGAEGFAANIMRTVRYALSAFLAIGVYPLAFRLEKKIGSSAASV